jgi:hypothetical protein
VPFDKEGVDGRLAAGERIGPTPRLLRRLIRGWRWGWNSLGLPPRDDAQAALGSFGALQGIEPFFERHQSTSRFLFIAG